MEKVGTAFVNDEEFFKEHYGVLITPFCKDLFSELLELDARMAKIEADAERTCQE
jgi:hypothetical protein